MKSKLFLVAALSAVMLTGCAGSLTSGSYTRAEARQAMQVQLGTVASVRDVKIEGTPSDGLGVGSGAGGLIGAIAGSNLGNGKGAWIMSVLGAVAGGVAGAAAEQRITAKDGIEVTIRMENGTLVAVTQEKDPSEIFAVGDKVRLIQGSGATRVTKQGRGERGQL